MNSKSETAADIIREMRDLGALDAQCNDMIPRSLQALGLRTYADRLEVARKRERGNASALREALEYVCHMDDEGYTSYDVYVAIQKARAALAAPPPLQGNAAALRAALESISENLAIHIQCGRFVAPGDHVSFPIHEAEAYIRDIKAALATPARNCDVGTANEQHGRFQRFCRPCEDSCPFLECKTIVECAIKRAQIPYEEGGAK